MVLLAGSTGLAVPRCVRFSVARCELHHVRGAGSTRRRTQPFRQGKTPASKKPASFHTSVADELVEWRKRSDYRKDDDFLFPFLRLNGEKLLSPNTVLKKIIRPALKAADIPGKVIGWHSFRHSLATNPRRLGVDVKTAQELLRHANSRIAMDIYTGAASAEKGSANGPKWKCCSEEQLT